ncbi:unnamed protein product [Closterium sp. Naga37s-1]|nr:unnamed protein product [Closterium sp. Naga37s-1]
MNLSGSFTSCYVATGSFSRTAVNILAGAHTALTQIILSFTMLIVLLAAAPAFKYVPACVVGAVIANSVLNLLDFKAAFQIWRVNTLNFILMLACFHRPLSPGFPSHLSPSSPPFSAGLQGSVYDLEARLQGSVYDLEGRQAGLHGHARLLPRDHLRLARDRPASRLRPLCPQAPPPHCPPAHPPARAAPGRRRYSRERATVPQQHAVRGDRDAED